MVAITNFHAFWHPGQNTFGITIQTEDGQQERLTIETPQEFAAVLAILNGPSPSLSPQGHIICSR
jgi:hypothetical protein